MKPISGPIATPMTPFSDGGSIDPEKIGPHVEWLKNNGIKGIFVLGTWGGFPLLTFDERLSIQTAYLKAANNAGVNSIVNIGTPALPDAARLIHAAEEAGAHALASLVPYYHSGAGYYGIEHYCRYFEHLRQLTDLPLYLYNNPRTTGTLVTPSEFLRLVNLGVDGVKDGSKDVGWITSVQSLCLDAGVTADIIPGNTTALLYAHTYGLKSITSGAAVSFPRLTADIFEALDRNDIPTAVRLHRLLLDTRRIINRFGNPAQVTYSLLTTLGAPDLGTPRTPWITLPKEDARRLADEIRAHSGLSSYVGA